MVTINPHYYRDRAEELRRHLFKWGRRLSDFTPDEQAEFMNQTTGVPIVQTNTVLLDRINHLQAELNYTRKKLDTHMDYRKKKEPGFLGPVSL